MNVYRPDLTLRLVFSYTSAASRGNQTLFYTLQMNEAEVHSTVVWWFRENNNNTKMMNLLVFVFHGSWLCICNKENSDLFNRSEFT